MDHKIIELFQTVCFLVVMQHGEGLWTKAPLYIQEKMKTIEDPAGAWNMLDDEGQMKVLRWARHWQFPLHDVVDEISRKGGTS